MSQSLTDPSRSRSPRECPNPSGIPPVPAVPVVLEPEAQPLDLGDAPDPLPVLRARDALGSGKSYWELELGRERSWALGVLRAGPSLPGPDSRDDSGHSRDDSCHSRDDSGHSRDDSCHSRRFWALRASQGRIFTSGGRALGEQRPGLSVLGLFLDLEKAQLEFYDVERTELLAGLWLEEAQGEFFPFVSRGEEEGALRIRPVAIPVPL